MAPGIGQLNRGAVRVVRAMIEEQEALGVCVSQLAGGATVVDAGVVAPGGVEAGRRLALACMGGLGQVNLIPLELGGHLVPGLQVAVEQPVAACLGAQYAGWALDDGGGFWAMGSGPARALAGQEEVIKELGLEEKGPEAVLALEAGQLPTGEAATIVATACQVEPESLYLVVARTASLAGSLQVAARVVETGVHKLLTLGYDVSCLRWGYGTCPLPPVASEDLEAIGRTNDAVLFGGRCYFAVEDAEEQIWEFMDRIPASASRDYGVPFAQLFQRYGDFYAIDPLLFSPAQVVINNLVTGETRAAGYINQDMLQRSLLGEEK